MLSTSGGKRVGKKGQAFAKGGCGCLLAFAAIALVVVLAGGSAQIDPWGVACLFVVGGLIGLVVLAIYNRGRRDAGRLIRRTVIRNARLMPMGIFVEPEGLDYWLMPDEEFEIRAEVSSAGDEFELVLHEDGVAVWPSHGMGDITVHKGNLQLGWSHQRPRKWPPSRT